MRSLHIFSLCSSVLFSFFLPHSNRLYYEIYYCFRGFVHCVWLQTQIELLETSILTFSKSYLSVNCKLKYAMFNIRLGFHDLRVLEVLFNCLSMFLNVQSTFISSCRVRVILHENKEPYSCLLREGVL